LKTYSKQYLTDFQAVLSLFLEENVEVTPVKCRKLRLVELSYAREKIAFCLSSGLLSIRPRKSDSEISIVHFDIFSNRLGTLDISLLPRIQQCTMLVLAAKDFSNMDELWTIRDKFPYLRELNIYTASDTVEGFVQEAARSADYVCRIASLLKFKDMISDTVIQNPLAGIPL